MIRSDPYQFLLGCYGKMVEHHCSRSSEEPEQTRFIRKDGNQTLKSEGLTVFCRRLREEG